MPVDPTILINDDRHLFQKFQFSSAPTSSPFDDLHEDLQ